MMMSFWGIKKLCHKKSGGGEGFKTAGVFAVFTNKILLSTKFKKIAAIPASLKKKNDRNKPQNKASVRLRNNDR